MKKRLFSMFLCLCLMLGAILALTPAAQAYVMGDNYPEEYKTPLRGTKTDQWAFYNRECVSFAAWCLESRNGVKICRWGSAYQWRDSAREEGYVVNQTPAVGAIAWWDRNVGYGDQGHVAWVSEVDENTVTIEEYNYSNGDPQRKGMYGTRTIPKSNPTGYIHVNDITPAPSQDLGKDFYAYIYNPHSDRNVENHSFNVQLATKAASDKRQIWHFIQRKDGSYNVINLYDKRYLEVSGAQYTYGANIQVMDGNDTNKAPNLAQRWKICGDDGVNFYFTPMLCDTHRCVMDVVNAGAADGTDIRLSATTYRWKNDIYRDPNSPISWAQTFQIKKISNKELENIEKGTVVKEPMVSAPTGVSGKWESTGSNASAKLTWKQVSFADHYEIGYKKDGGKWETVPICVLNPNTSNTFDKLDSSFSYSLRVRAVRSGVSSEWVEYSLPAKPEKLANPTGVSGSWISTGPNWTAKISWNAVSGATRYEVQYRTPKTGNAWKADPDYSSGTSYISTGLKDYNSYDYRVRACNSSGASSWITHTLDKTALTPETESSQTTPMPPSAPPSAPGGVSAFWTSAESKWQARVSWSAVSGTEHYEVQYKKVNGSNWSSTITVKSETSHTFSGLGTDASYDFRVKAVNARGSSGWVECSLPAREQIVSDLGGKQQDSIAAPAGISGTWTSRGPNWAARISWNAVSGATSYEVQYRTPKTGNAWKADPDYSSGTSYISTGLKDYDFYEYRVRAVKADKTSDWTEYKLEKNDTTSTVPPVHGSSQNSSVYIQQADSDGCYVAAAAMIISNYRLLNGGSAVTYAEVKTANGNSTYFDWGTFGKFGLKDVDLWTSANSGLSGSARAQRVLTALGKNDYGAMLCFRGKGKSHAVVITGYENGSIIVNDPARNGQGGEKIKLTDCKYIRDNITGYVSQEQMLTYANSLTYFVVTGSTNLPTPESPKLANPAGVSGSWTSTGPNWAARISWNAVSGATSYEVQYRTPKTGNAWRTDPDYSSGTSYLSTGLKDYNSYDYRVRACNSSGTSDWTTYTLVKPISTPEPTPTPPSAPSGVSGSWTSTGPNWAARISWNAVSGATRYEVQYRTPKTGSAWRADPDYSSGTSYVSTGLKDYNSYDYRVRACNSAGASAWTTYTLVKSISTPETTPVQTTPTPAPTVPTPTPPGTPSGVSGSWTSMGPTWQARISWNAVSGATYYEVQYRTPKTGNAWRADPDYSSGTSYISTGLLDYNSYDYRVRACNSSGASAWTTYTLTKPIPAVPAAPTGVSGSWTSMGPTWQARISWNAVSGATYYEVQYRTPKTGNAWRADPDYSSGTSYISTGLKDYNSYDYRVRAVNANGASGWTEYTLYK